METLAPAVNTFQQFLEQIRKPAEMLYQSILKQQDVDADLKSATMILLEEAVPAARRPSPY